MGIKEMLEGALKAKQKKEYTFEEMLAMQFRKMVFDNKFNTIDWNKAIRKHVSKWPERQQAMMRANLNARLTADRMTIATFKEGMAMFGIGTVMLQAELILRTDAVAGGEIMQSLRVALASE
jgi:hypothetical protein